MGFHCVLCGLALNFSSGSHENRGFWKSLPLALISLTLIIKYKVWGFMLYNLSWWHNIWYLTNYGFCIRPHSLIGWYLERERGFSFFGMFCQTGRRIQAETWVFKSGWFFATVVYLVKKKTQPLNFLRWEWCNNFHNCSWFLGISLSLVLKLPLLRTSFILYLLDFYFRIEKRKSYKQYAVFECTPFLLQCCFFPSNLGWFCWASLIELTQGHTVAWRRQYQSFWRRTPLWKRSWWDEWNWYQTIQTWP